VSGAENARILETRGAQAPGEGPQSRAPELAVTKSTVVAFAPKHTSLGAPRKRTKIKRSKRNVLPAQPGGSRACLVTNFARWPGRAGQSAVAGGEIGVERDGV
jgi:hypothetical protein